MFPPDTVVLSHHSEYRQAANDPAKNSFVRSIFLGYSPPRHLDLVEILTRADTEIQRLAKMCGAFTINVEFGFLRKNTSDDIQFDDETLIPRGLRLVGIVPIIRNFVCFDDEGFDTSSPAYTQTQKGIMHYKTNQQKNNYYALDAARIDQFGISSDGKVWLIDADPILSVK